MVPECARKTGVGYNGASPGPVLRFREGEDVTIHVTNNLSESTSVHWHGLVLPFTQDGVPGLGYKGIGPGGTFTYRFPLVRAGTYWFHSHSGQEPDGAYGAVIIEPDGREPFRYDRDHVVQLTDAHPHSADRVLRNLKAMPGYYNRQQRTLVDLVRDAREDGLGAALRDRTDWGDMRMMPTDSEDLQGFTPLINGEGPEGNWTGLFKPGERVRLRLINSSAMTYYDIRIPGLEMTVVQADGNNVQPVTVDELRIAVAETYDVIIRPEEDRAHPIIAESVGRTAMARGTLAQRGGMREELPPRREPPLLTMADMGMAHGDHGGTRCKTVRAPRMSCRTANLARRLVLHLHDGGQRLRDVSNEALAPLKRRLGLAPEHASCHTAEVDGYFVEGHVPAEDVERLLAERPDARVWRCRACPLARPAWRWAAPRNPMTHS
jgi:CopA family copper-resistance protein